MEKKLCPRRCLWREQRVFKHPEQVPKNPLANPVEAILVFGCQRKNTLVPRFVKRKDTGEGEFTKQGIRRCKQVSEPGVDCLFL
jgi:hypothetical protein